MKILPVFKNVPWNIEYLDLPKLWNVNVEAWLLKQYVNDSDISIWDEVKEVGGVVNSDRINASFVIGLDDLPKLYSNWNLYDLLKVNYFITDQGQYFFVNKLTGTEVVNNLDGKPAVKFNLTLDSWMTNLMSVIENDNVEREVKRGHSNRFIKNSDGSYSFDFNLSNPNWNPINSDSVPKLIKKLNVFSNIRPDFNYTIGTEITRPQIAKATVNELWWLLLYERIENIEQGTKLRIVQTVNNKLNLPYIIRAIPISSGTSTIKLKSGATSEIFKCDVEAFLKKHTKTNSEVIGGVITRGLFVGALVNLDFSKILIEDLAEYTITVNNTSTQTFIDNDGENGSLIIKNIEYNYNVNAKVDYYNYELLPIGKLSDKLSYFPSRYWIEKKVERNLFFELEKYFDKNFNFDTSTINNNKDIDKETYMYSEQMLNINLNTNQNIKPLSYLLLEGKLPILRKTASVDNAIISVRLDIETGKYVNQKFSDNNLVENSKIVIPTSTSQYNEYMLTNQSQIKSEGAGAIISVLLGLAATIGAIFTGGATAALGLGVSTAVVGASSAGKLISKDTDLKRLPRTSSGTTDNALSEYISNINNGYEYLTIEKPVERDLAYFYNEVYSKGVLWNFRYTVKWDSRYWFNYWSIDNMDKTVDVSTLNPDEVQLIKTIFMNGCRIWHIRALDQELDMSNFTKENLETEIVEELRVREILRLTSYIKKR